MACVLKKPMMRGLAARQNKFTVIKAFALLGTIVFLMKTFKIDATKKKYEAYYK
jgi:hypothetical protein